MLNLNHLKLIIVAYFLLALPLSAQNVRLIDVSTLAQLNAMRYDLNGDGIPTTNQIDYRMAFGLSVGVNNTCPSGCQGYELMNDLDFKNGSAPASAFSIWAEGSTASGFISTGWEPIGDNSSPFNTTFEGNRRTISNLYINTTTLVRVGLFGTVGRDGEIRNLGLEGGSVSSTARRAQVGSLVGYNNSGPISACYSTGDVTGGWVPWVGGLVGRDRGTISACYATGDVTGGDYASVGGLVGYKSSGQISACYATGDVTGGNSARAGGLVGENNATIGTCYSTGSARGGTSAKVGGLVGQNSGSGAMISACYSTGSARGGTSAQVGGLVGQDRSGTISNSYFDSQISMISNGIGDGDDAPGTALAKTTSELQSPTAYGTGGSLYENWNVDIGGTSDADDPWDFVGHNRYPRLRVDFDGDAAPTAAEFGAQRFYFTKTDPGIEVFSLSVSDEAVASTIIGYAKALSGTTTWALTDANFAINSGTGVITVKVAGATVATKMLSIEAMVGSVTTELNLNVEVTDVTAGSSSPTISSFQDAAGNITSALRGDIVKIIGMNFSTTEANNTITVGGIEVIPTSPTATVLTFTVPGAAAIGAGQIRASVLGAANYVEAAFMITTTALPTISSFQDNAGNALSPTETAAIGDIVKIIGTNFSTTPANNTITVGGTTATPTNATATELTFTVPLTATLGLGPIRVTVSGAANYVEVTDFTITSSSPTISSFQDTSGAIIIFALRGATVKIIGTNFSTTLVRNTITVGGATATLTSATATELIFTVPLTATLGSGQIRVTVLGAVSLVESPFTITLPSPTITRFKDAAGATLSPATAVRGATVKIIGTNFSTTPAKNTITVGGVTATPTNATATELTFTVPLTATLGPVQIRVTVSGVVNYVEEAFTITAPPSPTITRFEDAAGATLSPATAARGDIVKIIGTNFSTTPENNTITVGGIEVIPTAVDAIATELTFTVPAGASLGLGQIRVTVSGAVNAAVLAFEVTAPPALAFAEASTSDTDVGFTGAMGAEKAKYVVTKTLDEVDASGDVVLTLNVAPSGTITYAYVNEGGTSMSPPTGLAATINTNGEITTDGTLAVTSMAAVFYVQATRGGNFVIAKVELSVKPIVFAAPSPVDADVVFTGASGTEKAKYVVTKTLDEVDESGDVVLTLNVSPSIATTYAYVDMDGTLLAGPPTGLAATININGTISTDAALAVTSTARVFYVQATQGGNTVIAKVELTVNAAPPLAFAEASTPDTDVAFTGVSGDTKAKYVVTKTLDEVDASGDVVLTLNVDPSGTTTYAYVDMDGADADAPTGLASTINTNGEITTDSTLAVTSMAAVFYVQATQAANFVIAKVELTVNAPALAFAAPAPTDADVAFTAVSGATKAKYVVTKTLDEVDASGDVVLTLNVDPSGTTAYAYVDMDGAPMLPPPSRLVRPIPASGAISTTAALVVTSSAAVFYVQATQGGNTAIAKVELTVNAAATTDFLGLTNLAHDLVSLYPNPASDKVYVSGLKSGDVYIYEIYSFLGQKVGTGQLSEGPSIDLKGLSAGAYVLILRSESGEEVFRSRCLISK